MSLATYCEFGEIRAAFGVNSAELADSVLALPVYEMGLVRELNKLSTSLNAAFLTIVKKVAGVRTEPETNLYNALRLFSVYSVAAQVGVSLAGFMPKSVGDGKASLSRFAGEPYEDVMNRVTAAKSAYKAELVAAYEVLVNGASTAVSAPTIFRASPRSYDPVTGS